MAASITALKALAIARAQIGKPYVWGASGPNSFDCSGLAWYAYQHAGHTWGRTNDVGQAAAGARVSRANLLPGDLVRPHVGHIAIYSGDGRWVEAPQTGVPVREVPMWGFLDGTRISFSATSGDKLMVDGSFGPATISAAQRDLRVTVDGVFGKQSIRALQNRLRVTGDGVIGPDTIKALQRRLKVTVDGGWGAQTTSAYQRALNAGGL